MKEGKAAKRVISNLKEVGFVELALFTLSFSFHPNPVVASTRPTPPLSAYHIYSNKRCSPDAIKGNQLSNKNRPLRSTATELRCENLISAAAFIRVNTINVLVLVHFIEKQIFK